MTGDNRMCGVQLHLKPNERRENNNRSQQFGAVKLGVGVDVAAQGIWAAFCFFVEKHPKGGVDLTHTRAFLIKE